MLFAVFDTETTGLPLHRDADIREQPKIIEFGGIITDGDDILFEDQFICNPGQDIEPVIIGITGLTNDDLRDQPPFAHFVERVKNYFAKCDAVIAHNLSFDKAMVRWDLQRIGRQLSDVCWFDDTIEICTVEQTFHQYGRRMKLRELYNLLVGPYTQSHRSLSDVMALHEVCQKVGVYEAFQDQYEQSV